MKKSRSMCSQFIAVLKQSEVGAAVPDLCREHGISPATIYMLKLARLGRTRSGERARNASNVLVRSYEHEVRGSRL